MASFPSRCCVLLQNRFSPSKHSAILHVTQYQEDTLKRPVDHRHKRHPAHSRVILSVEKLKSSRGIGLSPLVSVIPLRRRQNISILIQTHLHIWRKGSPPEFREGALVFFQLQLIFLHLDPIFFFFFFYHCLPIV